MYIRCVNCHGSIWVETAPKLTRTIQAHCRHCDQDYALKAAAGTSAERLHEAARKCAQEEEIDLPGAYSLLFGILSREELRELGNLASPACHTASTSPPRSEPSRMVRGVDREFLPAIEAGWLTERQARHRGNRESYSRHLAVRHRLQIDLAHQIADNRITLLEAIRQRTATSVIEGHSADMTRWSTRVALLVLLLIAAGALYRSGVYQPEQPPELLPRQIAVLQEVPSSLQAKKAAHGRVLEAATKVERDVQGNVVRVVGPDPASVLHALCEARGGRTFRNLGIVPALPASPRARLGLLRDPERPEAILALPILQDRESGRWSAGDGSAPIDPPEASPAVLVAQSRGSSARG